MILINLKQLKMYYALALAQKHWRNIIKNRRKTMRVNESGRSMIEMLGVLAIIGVLSVGGIAGYSKAMTKFKTNKVVDQVSMIVTNIRTLYAQQTTYEGLTNKTAIQMGVIPDELGTDYNTGTLVNGFNGNVFIGSATSGSATDTKAFLVGFTGLPREACVAIATGDWGSGSSSGLIGLQASNAVFTATVDGFTDITSLTVGCTGSPASGGTAVACSGGTTLKVPMNVAQAAQACACTGNTCSVAWKYY